MKLHMNKISTTSRPVLLFIAENKMDVELVTVDLMTGENRQEPYSNLNPNKQVPVLEDGDFVLTESSAILKYLADKIDSPAYPKDPQKRARVNEIMDWFNTGYNREACYHMVYPQVFPNHERSPEESNKVTVEWGKAQAENWLAVLDAHWLGSEKKYLCGSEITLGDYFGASFVTAGELVGLKVAKFGNVARWVGTMKALPSWDSVYDHFSGFAESLKDKSFVTIS